MPIESLEQRKLLSEVLAGGVLTIVGTRGGDAITLKVSGSSLIENFNGRQHTFALADVSQIVIDGVGGNDVITVAQAISIPATISGGNDNDSIVGGSGGDSITGDSGNDTVDGGAGADSMSGGSGRDTVTYASRTASVTVHLGTSTNGEAGEKDTLGIDFETLIGGSGDDDMNNTGGNTLIAATLPNLLIEGGPGNDQLQGGNGNDTLLGGAGNDFLGHDLGNDVEDGGTGVNSIGLADAQESGGARLSSDGVANDGYADESDNVTNVQMIFGTLGNDTITGDDRDDTIDGIFGTDSISGGGGNDLLETSGAGTLLGGSGNDTLRGGNLNIDTFITDMEGGSGNDTLYPDQVISTLTGDAGNDVVILNEIHQNRTFDFSNSGFETILGSAAGDHIIGGPGNEVILGLGGDDTIEGNGGDDYIDGGTGQDSLDGGEGNDIFVNASGMGTSDVKDIDTVNGGDGIDFAQDDQDGMGQSQDSLTGIEFLYDPADGAGSLATPAHTTVSQPAIKIAAAPAATTPPAGGEIVSGQLMISGTGSADSISVILDSIGKNISVSQGKTSKTFPLSSVKGVFIDAGGGSDSIALAKGDGSRALKIPVTVAGGGGNDTILGGAGNDSLAGGAGNDSLLGGDGNDYLNGGSDASTSSSDGADFMSGGAGNDSVIYSQRQDNLNIDLSDGKKKNDGAAGEGDNVQTDVENVYCGNGDDAVVGNNSANLISGGGGNDTIKGGGGDDKLIGSRGQDDLFGQAGTNVFSIADGERDEFDAAIVNGSPVDAFVSGDRAMDFSSTSRVPL